MTDEVTLLAVQRETRTKMNVSEGSSIDRSKQLKLPRPVPEKTKMQGDTQKTCARYHTRRYLYCCTLITPLKDGCQDRSPKPKRFGLYVGYGLKGLTAVLNTNTYPNTRTPTRTERQTHPDAHEHKHTRTYTHQHQHTHQHTLTH